MTAVLLQQRTDPEPRPAGSVSVPFLRFATGVLSQVAVLTALLYYFGWVRTQGTFAFFGLNAEIAGLSAADYILRSVRPTLRPVLVVVFLALCLVAVHEQVIAPFLSSGRSRRRAVRVTLGAGQVVGIVTLTAALVVLAFGWTFEPGADLVAPIAVATAPLLVAYCQICRRTLRTRSVVAPAAGRPVARHSLRGLLYAISIGGLFWTVGVYAADSGWAAAESLSRELHVQPDIVVYSGERLAIAGTGVDVQTITQADSKFRFRYTGLRLLIKAGEHYILLPSQWHGGVDSAMVVDEADGTRFDVRSPVR